MMQFREPRADGDLLAELKDAGLLTPDLLERIDVRMGRPEIGALDEFLLAGAGDISEPDWLCWLIRRHGCHRFGPVRWSEEIGARWPAAPAPGPNLPYRASRDGGLLIAVLRPDRREGLADRLGAQRLLWAAATLREVGEVRAAWARWQAAP